MSQVLIDVLYGSKLHLEVVGELDESLKNEATNNPKCFVGGSYAMNAASLILRSKSIDYSDIDVYINNPEDSVIGDENYQNIILDKEEIGPINLKTASIIIHTYDFDCCKFFIYNDVVYGTKEGIKALTTMVFVVNNKFMGCLDTVHRVHKYIKRGFKIKTSTPSRIYCLTDYNSSEKVDGNLIYYPLNFKKLLTDVFDIDVMNKCILPQRIVPLHEDIKVNREYREAIGEPKHIKNNSKYHIKDIKNVTWTKILNIPTISTGYYVTDIKMDDNLAIVEFTKNHHRVTYIVDKNSCRGYYLTSIIRPEEKLFKIALWQDRLTRLGLCFNDNGVFLAQVKKE